MDYREKIFNAAREAYVDPDVFPESYKRACSRRPEDQLGDGLAKFIATELWEVMEGWKDDPQMAKDEAMMALENAEVELKQVRLVLSGLSLGE